MDDQKPPCPKFREAFTDVVLEEIRHALATAYDVAAEKHEPAVGSDALTFGVTLYRFAWHQLRALADRYPKTLTVEKADNADRMRIGEFVLGCHRVGSSADADINRSFPSNHEGAVARMINPKQQFFPGFESKPEDFAEHRDYVLAHLGSPEEGLGAIYLCIPAGRAGEKVERWDYTYLVWKRAELRRRLTAPELSEPTPPAPPPERVSDFEVPRRRKRKTDDEPPTE